MCFLKQEGIKDVQNDSLWMILTKLLKFVKPTDSKNRNCVLYSIYGGLDLIQPAYMAVFEHNKHDLHENCTELHGLLRSGWKARQTTNSYNFIWL